MTTPEPKPLNLYHIQSDQSIPLEHRIDAYVFAYDSDAASDIVFRKTRLTHVVGPARKTNIYIVIPDGMEQLLLSVTYPYRDGADDIRRIADLLDSSTGLHGGVYEPAAKLYAAGLRFTEDD